MKRILFVDDEPNILQGLERMLFRTHREWQLGFAGSGPEALALMARDRFDIIVSDMRMPGMNGAALLNEVKARYPDTVRFILSGQSDEETVMKSLESAHQFLAKPCDTALLIDSVNRALSLRELLNDDRLNSLISRIDSLPALPDAYRAIMKEMESADPSVRRVGEIIEGDIGMTARILNLVNSAFFGLGHDITRASQAAGLLGLETLKALVLAVGIFSTLGEKDLPRQLSAESLMRHSLAVGDFAKRLARAGNLDRRGIETAYTAGVLHDAGSLLLAVNFRRDYQLILDETQASGRCITESEVRALGCSHAEIGAYVLGIWGLPDSIVQTVAHHHAPGLSADRTFSPLAAVHIAETLVSEFDPAIANLVSTPADPDYLESLGWTGKLAEWRRICRDTYLNEGLGV